MKERMSDTRVLIKAQHTEHLPLSLIASMDWLTTEGDLEKSREVVNRYLILNGS